MFNNSITNSQQKSNPRLEFQEKNIVLANYYKELTPYQFYECMFGSLQRNFNYVVSDEHTCKVSQDFDELLELASFRNDIYILPCSFFNNYYKLVTLEKIYAFVIDIDYINPVDLKVFLTTKIRWLKHQPTLILNSGSGVHLYYVLDKPVECYTRVKPILKTILNSLKSMFTPQRGSSYKVDKKTTIIHPYRILGSLNKFNQLTRGFQIGAKISMKDLTKWLGIDWVEYRPNNIIKERGISKMPQISFLPNTKAAFYGHCISRVPYETVEGNRYMALFALSIVAYKCRIPKEDLREDLELLVEMYNQRDHFSKHVQIQEVNKAIKGYSPKYVRMISQKLEQWFGFEFNHAKRNGRKQADHLRIARAVKDAKQKVTKQLEIEKYLKINPSASANTIVRELRMSKTTVGKYLKIIRGIDGTVA